jgi:probable rRNA maturation factor
VSVLFRNSQKGVGVLPGSVAALADFVLEREGSPEKEVSVLFVDDSQITELNRRHLGRNGPTDVLAFPMSREGEVDLHPEILGDVVVSAERAISYAREHALDPGEELSLYLIHGILHLLGYDDVDYAEARRMRRREKELLGEASKRDLLVKIA